MRVFFEVQMTQRTDQPGWINSANFDGCSIIWQVDKNSSDLFGISISSNYRSTSDPRILKVLIYPLVTRHYLLNLTR